MKPVIKRQEDPAEGEVVIVLTRYGYEQACRFERGRFRPTNSQGLRESYTFQKSEIINWRKPLIEIQEEE